MKAAVLHAIDDIRYEEVPEPVLENEDQVKVRVSVCGICRSDVPRVQKGTAHSYPIILGHEFSGVVEEVGKSVTHVKPGDKVACVPLVPCMECEDCKKGNYSLCKQYSFIGSRQPGGYAEKVVVPGRNVVKLDKDVDFPQGALIETATIALHGFFVGGFDKLSEEERKEKRVAIIGVGTVGLFAVQWARILGAGEVIAIGRSEAQLELAKKLGATETINTAETKPAAGNFDFIAESAGSPATILQAFELIGNKGTIVMIGTPQEEVRFSWKQWEHLNRKEASVTGSWMSYSAPFPGREWEMATEAIRKGDLRFDEGMIYKTFPMGEAAEAFRCFKEEKVRGRILLTNDY